MRLLFLLFASVLMLGAATSKEMREKALSKGLQAIPADYETLRSVVDDADNPMSIEKIRLGKKLFFDKNLSRDRTIACATCHDIEKGGHDEKPTAIGYKRLPNPSHLNTPTVLNTAYSKHFFWDARAHSLREQAKGPTVAPFEMASTPALIEERMRENPEYRALFAKVFEDENPVTFENMAKAIEVYEKILVTRGDFDRFLEGEDKALSPQAQKGLDLFIDLGCKGCHFGPAVGGQKIQKFPLRDYNSIIDLTSVYDDKKKKRYVTNFAFNFKPYHPYPFKNVGGFMGKDGSQKFRVPVLRNITRTAPYYHNGVVKELGEAIFLMGRYQIGVDLNERQIGEIEAFFKTLEGTVVDYGLDLD